MKHLLLLIGLLVYGSIIVLGQKRISLSEAVETALERNPEVQQLLAQIEQKSTQKKTAIFPADPEAGYAREGMSAVGTQPFNEQRWTISQDLDFPLTTFYRWQALNQEQKAMEMELKTLTRMITSNIKKYYIDVLYALYLENLRNEELQLSKELYQAVRQREESGIGTAMDCLAAELTLAEAENQINDADRMLHEARYTLFRHMGLQPGEQTYAIKFQDSLYTREDRIVQQEAMAALSQHPAYLSQSQRIQSQDFRIQSARSEFLPNLSLGYMRQDFGTGYSFNGIEVGMSIPVWGLWKQKGQVQSALLKKDELAWLQTETLLELKQKIELAWHSYENSKVILERYLNGMRSKAETLQKLSLEAYQLGQIDLLKLIESQRLYLSAQKRYLDAVHEYYLRLAELEYFVETELVY